MPQHYLCLQKSDLTGESQYVQCTAHEDICPARQARQDIVYKVDTSYAFYLDNWLESMDMMCWAQNAISLPYVFYFVFFGLGGVLSYPFMDSIGRRTTNWVFTTINLVAQTVATFVPSYSLRLVMFAIMGLTCAKNSLCYTWLFEYVEKRHRSAASASVNFLDLFTCFICGAYFIWVSRNVQPLLEMYLYVGIAAHLFLCFFVPESPKWLLMQGRADDAIKSINYVARFNFKKTRFDSDIQFTDFDHVKIETNSRTINKD